MSETSRIDDYEPPRPQRTIGYEFLGYSAHMGPPGGDIPPAAGEYFPTAGAAKAAVQGVCPYPLEWDDNFYSINPPDDSRNGKLSSSIGGHPRAMAKDRADHASRYHVDSDPNILEELGHATWWNCYYVQCVNRPITEDIPQAEYVYLSFNIRRAASPGWWDVFFDNKWLESYPTYAEAMADIWQRVSKFERSKRPLVDRAFDKLDRWLRR